MPGPIAGHQFYYFEEVHKHCRDRGACQGPGCNASTGKTYAKRMKLKIRNLNRGR